METYTSETQIFRESHDIMDHEIICDVQIKQRNQVKSRLNNKVKIALCLLVSLILAIIIAVAFYCYFTYTKEPQNAEPLTNQVNLVLFTYIFD